MFFETVDGNENEIIDNINNGSDFTVKGDDIAGNIDKLYTYANLNKIDYVAIDLKLERTFSMIIDADGNHLFQANP